MSRTNYKLLSDKNTVKSSLCLSCKESSHGTDSITNNLEVTQMRCDASERMGTLDFMALLHASTACFLLKVR